MYNCTTELNGLCTDGDVRLEDGDEKYEGKIEICYNGEWASVCNVGVDDSVAVVVCRQLGFSLHSKNNLCLQNDIAYVHYYEHVSSRCSLSCCDNALVMITL